jgi:hypothetical protein
VRKCLTELIVPAGRYVIPPRTKQLSGSPNRDKLARTPYLPEFGPFPHQVGYLTSKMVLPLTEPLIQCTALFCCGRGRDDSKSSAVQLEDRMFGLQAVQNPLADSHQGKVSSGPESSPRVDIIFVHGLGGSARGTWTHPNKNQFWPEWLFRLEEAKNIRLYTFGYDSSWERISASRNYLGIPGFAHQLIDCLSLHYDKNGDVRPCLKVLIIRLQLFLWHTAWEA